MTQIKTEIRSLARTTGAALFAIGVLAAGGAVASAFLAPTTSPSTAGFSSPTSTIGTMSGSLTLIMGTTFDSSTDSLKAISDKLDAKLS